MQVWQIKIQYSLKHESIEYRYNWIFELHRREYSKSWMCRVGKNSAPGLLRPVAIFRYREAWPFSEWEFNFNFDSSCRYCVCQRVCRFLPTTPDRLAGAGKKRKRKGAEASEPVYPRVRLNRNNPGLIRQKTGYNNHSLALKKYLSPAGGPRAAKRIRQSLLVATNPRSERGREWVSSPKLRRPGDTLEKGMTRGSAAGNIKLLEITSAYYFNFVDCLTPGNAGYEELSWKFS